MYLNEVRLLGRLTRDPENRILNGGGIVSTFGLALNQKFKDQAGAVQERTTFVDIEAWARTAETIGKYCKKGDPLFIAGRLVRDEWTDKTSGEKRSRLKVVCESFQFLPTGRTAAPDPAPAGTTTVMNPPPPADDVPY